MYLGKKEKELVAADSGVTASVAPVAEEDLLFVPESWEEETVASKEDDMIEAETEAPQLSV